MIDSATPPRRARLAWLLFALVLLGALLRLAGAGRWGFHPDELLSAEDLLNPAQDLYHHYWVMPLGFAPLHGGILLLGKTHWGLRLGPIVLGVVSLGVLGWGLWRVQGARRALIATALVALSPWHIYFSQYGRFYSPAFCLTTIGLMGLLLAFKEGRRRWLLMAVLGGAGSVYAHTYALLPLAAALGTLGLLGWLDRAGRPPAWSWKRLGLAVLATGVLLLPLGVVLLKVSRAWAQAQSWNYGPVHTVMGILNNFTLPLAAMAAVGALAVWRRGDWAGKVLLGTAAGAAGLTVLAACFVSVRQDYFFPASVAAFALAACGIDWLTGRHGRRGALLTAAVLFTTLPNLASYYQCGNRYDFPGAVRFIERQRAPGERCISPASVLMAYYDRARFPYESWRTFVREDFSRPHAPAWLTFIVGRAGLDEDARAWLAAHGARLAWSSRPKRLDYFEFETQVWYWPGTPAAAPAAPGGK